MIDNAWVNDVLPPKSGKNSVMRAKVYLTIGIVLIGVILTVCLNGVGSIATQHQSQGIVIDFGNYETVWTDADYKEADSPVELLDIACSFHKYSHTVIDGKVSEINGVANTSERTWDLWYISKGDTNYTKSDSYDIKSSDYSVVTWAYTSSSEKPAVAVDASGTSIYGYAQATRMCTLSPVATEIVGSMNATSIVKGTDHYSNYPSSIVKGRENGTIAEVGTYTDPSYEAIMHQNPNLVISDGSQYKHIQITKTLRNSGIDTVLLYNGEDINTILQNIFIVGTAMHYELRAQSVISQLQTAINSIDALTAGQPELKVMISLSTSTSPYVAGNQTYASDILENVGGINIYKDKAGWAHINSEIIGHSDKYGDQYNPDIAIIVSNDPQYSATESCYNGLINGLSKNWKNTTAYSTGEIYLICESAGEMAQRSGPRFSQFAELTARIVCPGAFTDGITLPKYIGNDYEKYLTITKDLGFGD